MQIEYLDILNIVVAVIFLSSAGHLIFAVFAVEHFNLKAKKAITNNVFHPPVTILKPICGLDPEMAENLRSFCQQEYPCYQVIFGLQDANDPARPIVEEIIKEFIGADVSYIIDPRVYGANRKVANLINMNLTAKYDYLLIADSDMRVPSNYLSTVMQPFTDASVGAVTCLYSGSARGRIASSLNAMFINEWFFPSVLISRILQPIKYCLGATMIVRRSLLKEIGGFESLSNYLADDYVLGKLITNLGYKIYLSDFVVENIVEEVTIKQLLTHELRWARTLRRVEPLGYAFTFLTDTMVIGSVTAFSVYATTHNLLWALLPFLLVLLFRVILHIRTKQIVGSKNAGSIWLIPLRDILSFSIRAFSYTGNSIQWRNNAFSVDQAGLIHTEQQLQGKLQNPEKSTKLSASQI